MITGIKEKNPWIDLLKFEIDINFIELAEELVVLIILTLTLSFHNTITGIKERKSVESFSKD